MDTGILHLGVRVNLVSVVGVDAGGVSIGGGGVMHLTGLPKQGSWIFLAIGYGGGGGSQGVESSLMGFGVLRWGVSVGSVSVFDAVVSRASVGGGGVLPFVGVSRSVGTHLASNSAASTCDAAC